MGEHVVHWHVWRYGDGDGAPLLQAGYFVGCMCSYYVRCVDRSDRIQTWALQEAKARMEARGEKTQYP